MKDVTQLIGEHVAAEVWFGLIYNYFRNRIEGLKQFLAEILPRDGCHGNIVLLPQRCQQWGPPGLHCHTIAFERFGGVG